MRIPTSRLDLPTGKKPDNLLRLVAENNLRVDYG